MNMPGRRRRRPDPNALPRSRKVGPAPLPLPPMYSSAVPAGADQAMLRERRRRYQPVVLGSGYVNSTEVRECCAQLARDISRLKRPLVMRSDVDQIADAVHELQCVVVGLIAESRHLPADTVARSRQAVADLAVRPVLPRLRDEQLASGTWLGELVGYIAAYDGDLSDLLRRALPPDAPELRGNPSATERLIRALRELDHAVLAASRRLEKVAWRQQLPTIAEFNRQQQERLDAERRQRALSKLGV